MKKLILIFLVCLMTFGLFAHIIPDANFRACINEALDEPINYEPTIADLHGMHGRISANHRNIASIEGAQHLASLRTLELEGNQITDISSLSSISNLTFLSLGNNQITEIAPLSGLTSLITLSLSENQVADISPLSGLTSLRNLYLRSNQINDISPLTGLTNLVHFNLQNNLITTVSLYCFPSLESLTLSENQITDISLAGLPNIALLSLSENLITDISSLSDFTCLPSLELSNNQITDISPLSGLTGLTSLELSNNLITDVSPLYSLTRLTSLGLSFNLITDVSLSSLPGLVELDLTYNEITDISLLSMPSLRCLYLESNKIIDISPLSELHGLAWLDLDSNQISDTSSLSSHSGLGELYLHNNQITDISPLLSLSSLYSLDLDNNPLSCEAIDVNIPILQNYVYDLCYGSEANQNAACYPSPARDGAHIVYNTSLDWLGAASDTTYEVYFGTIRDSLISIGEGQYSGENNYTITPDLLPNAEYWWRVKSTSGEEVLWSGLWHFTTDNWVGTDDQASLAPHSVTLTNYPNPFNPSTAISFDMPAAGQASLEIYNVRGQRVVTLFAGHAKAGANTYTWLGTDNTGKSVASGTYFSRITTKAGSLIKKMMLLK